MHCYFANRAYWYKSCFACAFNFGITKDEKHILINGDCELTEERAVHVCFDSILCSRPYITLLVCIAVSLTIDNRTVYTVLLSLV